MSAGATLVLLPGLDGTDVFLRPLVAALPSTIRPVVVTYPTSGAEEYRDVLDLVRRATGGLPTFYVPAHCLAGRARAILDIDVRTVLCECRQPVHCISFTDDHVVPRGNVDAILAPAAGCASLAGSHFSGWMNGDDLAAEVEKFISTVETATL